MNERPDVSAVFGREVPAPKTIYALIGATRRMAEEFCRQRGIRPSEIGRTVFPSSMDPDVLRGRAGPVELVYGLDDDPRPFRHEYVRQDAAFEREAKRVQFWNTQRAGTER